MASDPRFDVFPTESELAERRRNRWTTCLVGCLVVIGFVLVLAIAGGIWVGRNWRDLAANFGTQILDQGIEAAEVAPEERREIKVQVERVTKALRDGEITGEQAGMLIKKLMESPLMPSLMVAAVDRHYFARSGLSDEEKAAGRVSLKRFARGMIDSKIAEPGIDRVRSHIADRQPDGNWRLRQQVSDDELRAALKEAKAQADEAKIPEQPENVDPSDEFKRIIDESLEKP